jgi:hypothetical protein
MANIIRNVDKIITSSNTEVDLDNITTKVSATGGDIVNTYTDAAGIMWKYHIFEQSGNFVVTKSGSVEFLIIGGGGCGGGHGSGGGGAGGLISSISGYKSGMDSAPVRGITVSPQSYQIFIGGGATGHAKGSDSTAFGLTAVGGGWGAGHYNSGGNTWVASGDGGSGGGGHLIYSGHDGMGGSGTHNQGFDGGDSPWTNVGNHACSGGGGSGEAGGSPANENDSGGKGGDGTLINCTGTDYYWAAGGGGGIHYNTPAGTGGRGGGGGGSGFWSGAGQPAGADGYKAGTAGVSQGAGGKGGENTGSGGGADGISSSAAGGQGGSGIVIIRYLA